MRRLTAAAVAGLVPLLMTAQTMPSQAQRGEKLFFEAAEGMSCAVCHAVKDKGTAVGPDLRGIAGVPPRAIKIAILSSRTQYVQEITTKNRQTFPAMKKAEGEYFDLSKSPPESRKLPEADIASTKDNAEWKHPPESAEMENDQLADIIAYLKWVFLQDPRKVDPGSL
jgi:mono/diheme cytochrome c family protein